MIKHFLKLLREDFSRSSSLTLSIVIVEIIAFTGVALNKVYTANNLIVLHMLNLSWVYILINVIKYVSRD